MGLRRAPSTFVIIADYALGAASLYAGLPVRIPPSCNLRGLGTVWLGGLLVAFLLPTALTMTTVLLRSLYVRHAIGEPGSAGALPVYDAIVFRVIVFVAGVHAMIIAALTGLLWGRAWAGQVVPVMLGFTMISIGNRLPRTRPNLAIGIRTRRTLSDRALWMRIHRSAGHMLVALGAVVVLSAVTLPAPVGPGMILLVGPAAIVGTCILVRFYQERADG